MEDITVWRSAHHMMKRYGDQARARAATRAAELEAKGDVEGSQLWQRIADAIDELERERPDAVGPEN